MMTQIIESNPMLKSMVESNPQMKQLLSNPEMLKQMMRNLFFNIRTLLTTTDIILTHLQIKPLYLHSTITVIIIFES